jgi:hypothetical protein
LSGPPMITVFDQCSWVTRTSRVMTISVGTRRDDGAASAITAQRMRPSRMLSSAA